MQKNCNAQIKIH